MKPQDRNGKPRMVAVMLIGNSGSGKSALLSQIGGNFPSGVSFRKGFTRGISEQAIELDGVPALLLDGPGLFEPDEDATHTNAKILTEVLKRDYDFKASARGPPKEELILMSKVNECVHQAQAKTRIIFTTIINQIMDDEVYDMYRDNLANDNFRSFLADLKINGYSFNDMHIDSVIMLRFDTGKIKRKEFGPEILPGIIKQEAFQVHVAKDISVTEEDIKNANSDESISFWPTWTRVALGVLASVAVTPLGPAIIAVGVPLYAAALGVDKIISKSAAKSTD